MEQGSGHASTSGNWRKNTPAYQILLVFLLSLNFGIVFFDWQALNALMPFVEPELQLSQTQIGFLAAGLSFSWALAAFFVGKLSDSLGKRKLLLIFATVAFSLCWVLSGVATSFLSLFAARLLMGAAEGGVMPISHAMGSCEVLSSVLGPPLAGMLNDTFGLSTFLWVLIAHAIVSGVVAMGLKETAPRALHRKAMTAPA